MIIRQEDSRKPIILLTTLLVGDATGYCKMLVWDNAVLSFRNVHEGDQLVLTGRYKVGLAKRSDPYFFEPKVRLHVPHVYIEIKLNEGDLGEVIVLDQAVSLGGLPPAVWNFHPLASYVENKVPHGRIVDALGVVLYHSRWERESCVKDGSTLTGQFWIRVWLKLLDHTCLPAAPENPDQTDPEEEEYTEKSVWVKMYVDVEKFENMERCAPGFPVVVTNLLSVHSGGHFSHLESTNETQLFPGDQAFSSRFINTYHEDVEEYPRDLKTIVEANNRVVKDFRHSWMEEQDAWKGFYEMFSFAGNLLPESSISKIGCTLRNLSEVASILQDLPFLTGARIQVTGVPVQMETFEIDNTGAYQRLESRPLNEDILQSADNDRYGESLLVDTPSPVMHVRQPYDLEQSFQVLQDHCFLSAEKKTDQISTRVVPGRMLLVLIQSRDFRIWACAGEELESELIKVKDINTKICLDVFRYRGARAESSLDGVEACLRKIFTQLDNQPAAENSQQNASQVSTSSQSANDTIDFVNVFR